MSKVKFEVKNGNLVLDVDTNEDGESSVNLKLNLSEAIQEAIAKGQPIEGAKVVDFKFDGPKLKIKLDTDKDGEQLIDLTIDLGEAFDEIKDAISKD